MCSKPVTGNLVINSTENNFSSFTTGGFYERRINPSSTYNGSGVTDELDGRIDEVKVFNRVLNSQEISSYYDQGDGLPQVPDCPPGTITIEYRRNGGDWTTGNILYADEGDEIYIRAKDYTGEYYLTTPIPYGPTFSSDDDLSTHNSFNAYQIDTSLTSGRGLTSENNNGTLDSNGAGQYVFTTAEGCIEVFTLKVSCLPGSLIPEYRLDGIWSSGDNDLTVAEGTEVVLSMLPNNIGVSITLPDGTVVGDDYNLGNVTPANNGVYILTSAEGCESFLELTVTAFDCTSLGLQTEYRIDSGSSVVGSGTVKSSGGINP